MRRGRHTDFRDPYAALSPTSRSGFGLFHGRLAVFDVVEQSLDIGAGHGVGALAPEQGLQVKRNSGAIGSERAGLFMSNAFLEVYVTEFPKVIAFRPSIRLTAGSRPPATSPSNRLASLRAASGVHGDPCRPIVNHRCRPPTRYLTRYVRSPPGATRNPKPETSLSHAVKRAGCGRMASIVRFVSLIQFTAMRLPMGYHQE